MAHDEGKYPARTVIETAELAASRDQAATPKLLQSLAHSDSAVRYWAVTGLLIRGAGAVGGSLAKLRQALKDTAPSVRIAAAEALARHGQPEDLEPAMNVLLDLAAQDVHGVYVSLQALNAIDAVGVKAKPWKSRIAALARTDTRIQPKLNGYVPRLLEHIDRQLS
jgi:uncharacterized sulfatase